MEPSTHEAYVLALLRLPRFLQKLSSYLAHHDDALFKELEEMRRPIDTYWKEKITDWNQQQGGAS